MACTEAPAWAPRSHRETVARVSVGGALLLLVPCLPPPELPYIPDILRQGTVSNNVWGNYELFANDHSFIAFTGDCTVFSFHPLFFL